DYIPRSQYQSDLLAYFARIDDQLRKRTDRRLFFYGKESSPIYDFHLSPVPSLAADLSVIRAQANGDTYLFAKDHLDDLLSEPALVPITAHREGREATIQGMMFRVLPASAPATSLTLPRFDRYPPVGLAALGNVGE